MNIVVNYLYRDAGNYKSWGKAKFTNKKGVERDELLKMIKDNLLDYDFMVAEKVGLPTLYFKNFPYDPESDHEWHEFNDIEAVPSGDDDECIGDIMEFIDALACDRENWRI